MGRVVRQDTMTQERHTPDGRPFRIAVSVKTAAEMLEISVSGVNRLVRAGKLTKCRINDNTTRIPVAALEALVEATQEPPSERSKQ